MSVFDLIGLAIGKGFFMMFKVILNLVVGIIKNVVYPALISPLILVRTIHTFFNQVRKNKEKEENTEDKNNRSNEQNITLNEVYCYESAVNSNGVTTLFVDLIINDNPYMVQVDYHNDSLTWFGLGNKSLQSDFTTEEMTEILSLLNNHFNQQNKQIPEKTLVV